jgi:hypothetical protein
VLTRSDNAQKRTSLLSSELRTLRVADALLSAPAEPETNLVSTKEEAELRTAYARSSNSFRERIFFFWFCGRPKNE